MEAEDAVARFLAMLAAIVVAKKKHDQDPRTERAREDSGHSRAHKIDEARCHAREVRGDAFHALRKGIELHASTQRALDEDARKHIDWRHQPGASSA